MIESLESRRLLSVSFGDDRVIRVKLVGLNKDVVTAANIDSQRFRLTINGDSSIYRWKQVEQISVSTYDGADLLDFRDLKVPIKVDGGKGGDTIYGGRRNDSIFGSGGADLIFGNEGNDTLEGGLRDDTLRGGVDDDTLIPFSDPLGDDSVFGEAGTDTVDYSNETKHLVLLIKTDGNEPEDIVTDDIFGDVEVVKCGPGNDAVSCFLDTPISIFGGAGNDTLSGGTGNDYIDGGTGKDWLIGVGGNDRFVLGVVDGLADSVNGGKGNDLILDSQPDSADVLSSVS
jgi:Ca2+-binding RTX toxin-like protein